MADTNPKVIATQQAVRKITNPTGKGGFQDHPELRNPGGWKPEFSFPYQYKRFMNMDLDEYKSWQKDHPKRTVVEDLAYTAVFKAKSEIKYLSEVANRADGMPKQSTDITTNGKDLTPTFTVQSQEAKEQLEKLYKQ